MTITAKELQDLHSRAVWMGHQVGYRRDTALIIGEDERAATLARVRQELVEFQNTCTRLSWQLRRMDDTTDTKETGK